MRRKGKERVMSLKRNKKKRKRKVGKQEIEFNNGRNENRISRTAIVN